MTVDAVRFDNKIKSLLSSEEYKNFPEVIKLKQQLNNSEGNHNILHKDNIELELKGKISLLQEEYNNKLNQLISLAKQEYYQIKSGKKAGSKTELMLKYLKLARALEEECDVRVYAVITYTENELAYYGYDRAYLKQAKEDYQKMKKERREMLYNKS